MSALNSEYYFLLKQQDDRIFGITPGDDTVKQNFGFERMPVGSKPLVFHNGNLDWQIANRVKPMNPPPDILFSGSDVLIKDQVREAIWSLELPNLAIQPSIYIDHNSKWHENYWYLTFLELFDCWDRKNSIYRPKPIDVDGNLIYNVRQYSLDDDLLEKTPIDARRLFKMGGTLDGMVVVHQSLAKYFRGSGAYLVPIADYGVTYP